MRYRLTRIGARLGPKTVWQLNHCLNYLEVGRWMHAKGFDANGRLNTREEIFDVVVDQVRDKDVLYLEFGVFKGVATRYWSEHLKNSDSKLHGFDSFEGLPEEWFPGQGKGRFNMDGKLPQIDDPRVKFFKGYFNETLPDYKCPSREVLVVNLDADLYSSTVCVLNALKEEIVPGTYVYFDEFSHRDHELKAFDEFLEETGMKFCTVGSSKDFSRVMFQRIS